jgi:GDP-mannose 6-dehydrogenase
MNISVFGLGYVGCVSAACLAKMGNHVIGVDINSAKVDTINRGKSPIVELEIDDLVRQMVSDGSLKATNNVQEAILDTDLAFICVGTPSEPNGSLDASAVINVAKEIGSALRDIDKYFVVAIRSTVLPGTVEKEILPQIEKYSHKKCGKDWGICMNPEFLREGTSVSDFFNPPKTVIGESDARAGDIVASVHADLPCELFRTDIAIAEMVKYSDNAFHALKIVFANEIGSICKKLGIDSHRIMDIFTKDRKLNISPAYLRPGFSFGGSCLGKDLRALTHLSRTLEVEPHLLSAILVSNDSYTNRIANELLKYKGTRIGFLGLSFKSGTDDLRESPTVNIVEFLLGKGFDISICDTNVQMSRVIGGNEAAIRRHLPHIETLLERTVEELVAKSDVVVLSAAEPAYIRALEDLSSDGLVFDLVRAIDNPNTLRAKYIGVAW